MADIKDGGYAFPNPADDKAGWHAESGMTLRDWFATVLDKDEYGDILYRYSSLEMEEALAGPKPSEPNRMDQDTKEARIAWRIETLRWQLKVRAAIRFMMADEMIAARERQK